MVWPFPSQTGQVCISSGLSAPEPRQWGHIICFVKNNYIEWGQCSGRLNYFNIFASIDVFKFHWNFHSNFWSFGCSLTAPALAPILSFSWLKFQYSFFTVLVIDPSLFLIREDVIGYNEKCIEIEVSFRWKLKPLLIFAYVSSALGSSLFLSGCFSRESFRHAALISSGLALELIPKTS